MRTRKPMTKKQAVALFKQLHLPFIEHEYFSTIDYPYRRQLWDDYVDSLQRDNRITEKQASTWTQPSFCNPKNYIRF